MNSEHLPWPEKHRPQHLDAVVGNQEVISALKIWVNSWALKTPARRAALLIGPPGTGKTASVGALANDLDMELVEFNSSDKRNALGKHSKKLRKTLQALFSSMNLIA